MSDVLIEVKDLIEREVQAVLDDDESRKHHTPLVNHLTEALGSDASWVELYRVTGELIVPEMPQDNEFGEKLSGVKEVSQIPLNIPVWHSEMWGFPFQALAQHRHSDAIEGSWREIRIPVDVPQVQVRVLDFDDVLCLSILMSKYIDHGSCAHQYPSNAVWYHYPFWIVVSICRTTHIRRASD